MANFNWPINPSVVSLGAIQFVRNGANTQVSSDSVTPANSRPLPVQVFNPSGSDAGLATETTLSAINTKTPAQGQALMAASTPVVIASDQSAVPVTGPLTDAELRATAVPVSAASLPLPTGAATETTLAALNTKVPAQGAALTAASLPVNIASDQTVPVSGPLTDTQLRATPVPVSGPLTDTELRATAVPVSAASLPLPTGAATETTLAAINTKIANDFGVLTGAVRVASQVGNASGAADFGTGNASAQTIRVVIVSDQPAFPTTSPINAAGSHTTSTVGAVAATLTAPANAVGFLLQASDQNATNIRWAIGATASAAIGSQLQPGRGTGYVPCGANVSIISESGTNEYEMQWVMRS